MRVQFLCAVCEIAEEPVPINGLGQTVMAISKNWANRAAGWRGNWHKMGAAFGQLVKNGGVGTRGHGHKRGGTNPKRHSTDRETGDGHFHPGKALTRH